VRAWFIRPRVRGYSLMGLLNMFVIQWFCMRIEARLSPRAGDAYGDISFGLIGPLLPLSGWWGRYVWLGKPRGR